jgi:HSP20 family molecular chaperone IbpA
MTESLAIRKTSSVFDQVNEIQERITQRAYEIFERNGAVFGRELDNWLQAEEELLWKPSIELREKNGELLIEAALSGLDPKDVEIEVTPEDIILKAETQHQHQEQKSIVHICEFKTGMMFRSIHLPRKINPDRVKAEFNNGLLRLTAQIAQETRATKSRSEAA